MYDEQVSTLLAVCSASVVKQNAECRGTLALRPQAIPGLRVLCSANIARLSSVGQLESWTLASCDIILYGFEGFKDFAASIRWLSALCEVYLIEDLLHTIDKPAVRG
jgi:hypothetical protein